MRNGILYLEELISIILGSYFLSPWKLLVSIRSCSQVFQFRHCILELASCLFCLRQCWPTVISTIHLHWPLCYSCTDAQTKWLNWKLPACKDVDIHAHTWITYFKHLKEFVQDQMKRHWKSKKTSQDVSDKSPINLPSNIFLSGLASVSVVWFGLVRSSTTGCWVPQHLNFWSWEN